MNTSTPETVFPVGGDQRFQFALAISGTGTFGWHLEEGKSESDARMLELFGLPPNSNLPFPEALESYIHPEDQQRYREVVARALDPAGDGSLQIEFRVPRPDGSVRWLTLLARVFFEAEPRPSTRIYGLCGDITERKVVEEALRISEEQYRTLFDSIDEGFCIIEMLFDEQDHAIDYRFLEVNPAFERHTGIQNSVGRTMREIAPEHEEHWFETYGQVAKTGVPIRFENSAEQLQRWYDVYAFRMGPPEERKVAVLFNDISERKRVEAETASLLLREQKIALQLQGSLQPSLSPAAPGLDLQEYYRAALQEAQVGGDFYDVFPVTEHCSALVVGDVSGKGLTAAAEVGTVRNMLRFALYEGQTVADAVRCLNRVLVQNHLLDGFATLFVGLYDHDSRLLTYVSCGQEPALVWRSSTGEMEELPPTGSILGVLSSVEFEQQIVKLSPGDLFAIFSDGLTDAGPNRQALLGVEGVAALLRELPQKERASEVVSDLMAAIDTLCQGTVQDDICLLVGVVESSTSAAPSLLA